MNKPTLNILPSPDEHESIQKSLNKILINKRLFNGKQERRSSVPAIPTINSSSNDGRYDIQDIPSNENFNQRKLGPVKSSNLSSSFMLAKNEGSKMDKEIKGINELTSQDYSKDEGPMHGTQNKKIFMHNMNYIKMKKGEESENEVTESHSAKNYQDEKQDKANTHISSNSVVPFPKKTVPNGDKLPFPARDFGEFFHDKRKKERRHSHHISTSDVHHKPPSYFPNPIEGKEAVSNKSASSSSRRYSQFKDQPKEGVINKKSQKKLDMLSTAEKDDEKDREKELSEREFENYSNRRQSFISQGRSHTTATPHFLPKKQDRIRNYVKINKLIILPDDPLKQKWNFLITLLLLFVALVTPFRVAFYDVDSTEWYIADFVVDGIFLIDIILNFFTCYFDSEDNLVTDRKVIALSYIKSWFFIDIIAIIPISLIVNSKDYTALARIARLPRLYRLMKMTKLARMLKIVKERNKFIKYLNEMLRLSVGVERLLYFILIFILLCHITACLWYLLAKLDNISPETWVVRDGLINATDFEIYMTAFYYTVTTITTVGYGDINAHTVSERMMAIILMMIGVMSYSFAVGSLSSVITSLDTKQAKLKEKLSILEDLKKEYCLSYELYMKLKKALKYDHSRNVTDRFKLLQELPQTLKIELSIIMHQQIITKIPFFQNRSPVFMAFIGPMLRPIKVLKNEYIYVRDDIVDEIYFLVKGQAALVLKKYNDLPYVIINEGYYFGETDILNIGQQGELLKRMFTVKALKDCELLVLAKADLIKVYEEFPDIVTELLQNAESRIKRSLKTRHQAIEYMKSTNPNSFTAQESKPKLNEYFKHTGNNAIFENNRFKSTMGDIDENEEFLGDESSSEQNFSLSHDESESPRSKKSKYYSSEEDDDEFSVHDKYYFPTKNKNLSPSKRNQKIRKNDAEEDERIKKVHMTMTNLKKSRHTKHRKISDSKKKKNKDQPMKKKNLPVKAQSTKEIQKMVKAQRSMDKLSHEFGMWKRAEQKFSQKANNPVVELRTKYFSPNSKDFFNSSQQLAMKTVENKLDILLEEMKQLNGKTKKKKWALKSQRSFNEPIGTYEFGSSNFKINDSAILRSGRQSLTIQSLKSIPQMRNKAVLFLNHKDEESPYHTNESDIFTDKEIQQTMTARTKNKSPKENHKKNNWTKTSSNSSRSNQEKENSTRQDNLPIPTLISERRHSMSSHQTLL